MQKVFRKYAEAFLSKIRISDNCWTWVGGTVRNNNKNPMRYGRYVIAGDREHLAHRFSYELFRGPIPKGLHLDHLCRNTLCVNPAHLEPVTQKENLLRGNTVAARNAAKMKCPKGHPFSGENLIVRKKGNSTARACRECTRARERAYYAANKEKFTIRRQNQNSPKL